MSDRRINPIAAERGDHLKAIAGLIQRLSYRDMQTLSQLLCPNGGSAELAGKLLEVSDDILAQRVAR